MNFAINLQNNILDEIYLFEYELIILELQINLSISNNGSKQKKIHFEQRVFNYDLNAI